MKRLLFLPILLAWGLLSAQTAQVDFYTDIRNGGPQGYLNGGYLNLPERLYAAALNGEIVIYPSEDLKRPYSADQVDSLFGANYQAYHDAMNAMWGDWGMYEEVVAPSDPEDLAAALASQTSTLYWSAEAELSGETWALGAPRHLEFSVDLEAEFDLDPFGFETYTWVPINVKWAEFAAWSKKENLWWYNPLNMADSLPLAQALMAHRVPYTKVAGTHSDVWGDHVQVTSPSEDYEHVYDVSEEELSSVSRNDSLYGFLQKYLDPELRVAPQGIGYLQRHWLQTHLAYGHPANTPFEYGQAAALKDSILAWLTDGRLTGYQFESGDLVQLDVDQVIFNFTVPESDDLWLENPWNDEEPLSGLMYEASETTFGLVERVEFSTPTTISKRKPLYLSLQLDAMHPENMRGIHDAFVVVELNELSALLQDEGLTFSWIHPKNHADRLPMLEALKARRFAPSNLQVIHGVTALTLLNFNWSMGDSTSRWVETEWYFGGDDHEVHPVKGYQTYVPTLTCDVADFTITDPQPWRDQLAPYVAEYPGLLKTGNVPTPFPAYASKLPVKWSYTSHRLIPINSEENQPLNGPGEGGLLLTTLFKGIETNQLQAKSPAGDRMSHAEVLSGMEVYYEQVDYEVDPFGDVLFDTTHILPMSLYQIVLVESMVIQEGKATYKPKEWMIIIPEDHQDNLSGLQKSIASVPFNESEAYFKAESKKNKALKPLLKQLKKRKWESDVVQVLIDPYGRSVCYLAYEGGLGMYRPDCPEELDNLLPIPEDR